MFNTLPPKKLVPIEAVPHFDINIIATNHWKVIVKTASLESNKYDMNRWKIWLAPNVKISRTLHSWLSVSSNVYDMMCIWPVILVIVLRKNFILAFLWLVYSTRCNPFCWIGQWASMYPSCLGTVVLSTFLARRICWANRCNQYKFKYMMKFAQLFWGQMSIQWKFACGYCISWVYTDSSSFSMVPCIRILNADYGSSCASN